MLIAYQTLIRSDIDIAYPAELRQDYSETIDLTRSPHKQLMPYEHKLVFGKNQNRNVMLYSRKPFLQKRMASEYALEVQDLVTFHWRGDSNTIHYIPQKEFSLSLMRYWFLRGALIFYFLLRGKYRFLHAGAVGAGGKTLLFSAQAYGGKSTLTDYFIKRGHPLFTDDKVAIYLQNNRYYAAPTYPYYRPHRALEDLGYFNKNSAESARPIDLLYRLKRGEPSSEIKIEKLSGIETFKAFHFSNELRFLFPAEEEMRFMASLSKRIPVYQITLPWDTDRLPEVYEAILAHSGKPREKRKEI